MAGQVGLKAPSGGVVTLNATDTASNFTVTFPANTGTVVTTASTAVVSQTMLGAGVASNGPAFAAYLSTNQTVAMATFTKVALDTKVFDTNTNYSTSTYRFTPTVAGYYQVNGAINASGQGILSIYKNGTAYQYQQLNANATTSICTMTCLLYLNGSTDYIELWAYSTAGTTFYNGNSTTTFSAAMVRSA
jgi:hypothetical protein